MAGAGPLVYCSCEGHYTIHIYTLSYIPTHFFLLVLTFLFLTGLTVGRLVLAEMVVGTLVAEVLLSLRASLGGFAAGTSLSSPLS